VTIGKNSHSLALILIQTRKAEREIVISGGEEGTSLKILVTDDEPEILRFFKIMLEDEGYTVITARNGLECLQAYKTELNRTSENGDPFDVVLLDYRMPGLNGVEVANQILALHPNQKLLMVTAYSGLLDIKDEKFKKMKIMAKPFDPEDLLTTISQLAKSKE
jgi:CheY-like chemotaxis protein